MAAPVNPWENDWGTEAATAAPAPWEQDWKKAEEPTADPERRIFSFSGDIKKARNKTKDPGVIDLLDSVESEFSRAKVGDSVYLPFANVDVIKTGSDTYEAPSFKGPRITQERAFELAAETATMPGGAGMKAAGLAAKALPAASGLVRSGASVLAGAAGAMGAGYVQNKAIEAINPEAAKEIRIAAQDQPGATLAGSLLGGNAPYQRLMPIPGMELSLKDELLQRALGAGIAGGIQAGTDVATGVDPSLESVGGAALGGALFNDPTKLGKRIFQGKIENPITSRLGSVKAGDPLTKITAESNNLALPVPEGPTPLSHANALESDFSRFQPIEPKPPIELNDSALQSKLLAGELAQRLIAARQEAGLPSGAEPLPLKPMAGEMRIPEEPKPRIRGLEPKVGEDLSGFLPVEPKRPMDFGKMDNPFPPTEEQKKLFEADTANRKAAEQTEKFNQRVLRIIDNLSSEGVELDRTTAVKLARISDPAEFNAARQQLIDSVNPKLPEIPVSGPIRNLTASEGPIKNIADIPGAYPRPKEPALAREQLVGEIAPEGNLGQDIIDTAANKRTMDIKRAEGEIPSEVPITAKATVDDYTRYQEIQKRWADVLKKDPNSPEIGKLWAENEEIKNRHDGMPPEPPRSGKESGFILNPVASRGFEAQLSQVSSIEFATDGNGNYQVTGISDGGKKGKKAKYGSTRVPLFDKVMDESLMRDAFGDKIANRIIEESQRSPRGKIEGLTSLDFKRSPMQSQEGGAIINPIGPALDVVAKGIENAAAERAATPKRKSMFDEVVSEKAPEETVARPAPKKTYELKDVVDPVTGKELPENIKHNERVIYEQLRDTANRSGPAAPVPEHVASDIAKAPEEYVPLLTDMAARWPVFDKAGLNLVSKGVGSASRLAKKVLGTVVGNIREVSPRVVGAIREKSRELNSMRVDFTTRADALGELSRNQLTPEEFNALDAANLSGDRAAAMRIFDGKPKQKELIAAYDAHQAVMGELLALERSLGRDIGEVDTYFRRRLVDRDGLLKALGKDGESVYDDVLRNAEKTKGSPLTQEEKDKALNGLVAGSARHSGTGTGWLKPRTIEKITQNLLKFYEPFDVATHDYIMSVTRDISNRKWLGKTEGERGDYEGDFGRIIREEKESGRVGNRGLNILTKNLQDYLSNSSKFDQDLSTWANRARKIQTYAYLADIGNSIIQGAEYFTLAWKYGFGNATKGLGNFKKFNLEDLNIYEGGMQDFVNYRRGRNDNFVKSVINAGEAAYAKSMRAFIGKADQVMTGATASAAWKWASDVVRNPESSEFKRLNATYSKMFPERWPEILKDLKTDDFRNGKLNDNTRLFLFNEVSNLKPMDHADRAQLFNSSGPWAKLLYTLRTYPIKQLDVMREIGYEGFKHGESAGEKIKALGRLAAFAAIVGAGQQSMNYLRDLAMGRETDLTEYGITGLLQLAMIPRYAIYRAKEAGIPDAIIDTAVPGLGFARDASKDLQLALKANPLAPQRDSNGRRTVEDPEDFFKQSRLVQYAPAIGRPVYWWFGGGAESEARNARAKLEGKSRPGTLQGLGDLVVPPDLKTPRKN